MRSMIQTAPAGVFTGMVLLALGMAAVAVIAGLKARRQARVVGGTAISPIGMAARGYRHVEGTAEAIDGQTVVAPLTGSACVWYSATVEEWTRAAGANARKSDWRTVRSVTSSAPLLVRDTTGACLVRVFGAEITPRDKSRWTGESLEPTDRNPARLGPQESSPMVQVSGTPTSRFRYSETRIYPGDPITVAGVFHPTRDAAPDLDALPPDPSIAPGWTPDADDASDAPGQPAAPVTGSHGRIARDAWEAADIERHDTLSALAARQACGEMEAGGRGQPLVIAAMSGATHAYMNEMGSQAAFMVALVPLGLAALMLLVRWG